ncbi:helix-turn-helix domain-containing protein [Acinetobacter terrae]|uniref:helix-turn-helix domain-containing protein n=1 Tax=Acinetobacter terrae TaxID=2731247 RepID=UPI00331430D7
MLCLSYWREYRTLFHVATSYGVSEPTASRIVRHVEDCLIQSNLFNLPKSLCAATPGISARASDKIEC